MYSDKRISKYVAKQLSEDAACSMLGSSDELLYLSKTVLAIKGSRDWDEVVDRLYFEATDENNGEPPSLSDVEERVDVFNEGLIIEFFKDRMSSSEIDNIFAKYIHCFSPYSEEYLVEHFSKRGYLYTGGPRHVELKYKREFNGQNVLLPEFLL